MRLPDGPVVDAPIDAAPTEAMVEVNRPTLTFGTVMIGETSPPMSITVTNTGETASSILTLSLTGEEFAVSGSTCDAPLAAGADCTLSVTFTPAAVGPRSAMLEITGDPGGSAISMLEGEGGGTGALAITSETSDLGPVVVGETGTTVATFIVTNNGNAATAPLAVTAAGTDPGEFTLANDDCTDAGIVPGATCSFDVRLAPASLGAKAALFQVSATGLAPVSGAVSGTGTPRLEITALDGGAVVNPVDFGTAVINNTTPHDVVISVENHASTAQTLGITLAAGTPPQYVVAGNPCGPTIAAQATCDVTVRFAPTTIGVKTGTITFDIGAGAASQVTQNLTGIGIESLTLTALSGANFGVVATNTTATRQFQLTNAPGSVTTGTLAVSFTGGAELAIRADACNGQTLAGGASCLIDVRFAPLTPGAVTGMLAVTATPGGVPSIVVTGQGGTPVGTAPTAITLTPSSIAENQPINTTVGTLGAVDADAGDTFTFGIVAGAGGADNALFGLTGAAVRALAAFDAETRTSYSIRVQVIDSGGNVFEAPVAITVTNVDEPPVAVADARVLLEDAAATAMTVLANDTDLDGGPKTVTTVTPAGTGTTAIIGGGADVTYRPAANANGTDSFSYTLNGGSTAGVTVSITPVNDVPAFTAGPAVAVAEDSGAQTVPGWATTIGAGAANESGQTVLFLVTADQPALFASLPAISPTGTLTFTPAANIGGTATISVRVQDNGGTANGGVDTSPVQTFTITITSVNDAPAITSTPSTTATEDMAYVHTAVAMDGDGPTFIWSTVAAHTCGGTLGASTGIFTFTPAGPGPPASCVLAFRVCDGGSPSLCSAAQTTTITITAVNDAPVVSSTSPTVATEDSLFTYTATVADLDGPTPIAWSLAAAHTCGGTVNAAGVVTFTPAGPIPPASCVLAVQACDGASACGTHMATVTITAANDAPTISGTAPAMATEDVAYTFTPTVVDPDGPSVTWSIVTPTNTCSGATINPSTGAYTFTPTGPVPSQSSCVLAIRVCDGSPGLCSAASTRTVTIVPVNDAPAIGTISGTATEDLLFTFSPTVSDPDGPAGRTWTFGTGHTCGGTIVGTTGVVTFTPAGPNPPTSCVLSLSVCDSGTPSQCGTGSGTITITGVNDAPLISSTPPSPATEDMLYTYTAVVNDPDGPSRIWSLSGDSCGGSIGATSGVYTFTNTGPTPPTACTVGIQVCDGASPSLCDTQSQRILITPVNDAPVITDTPPPTATEDVLYRHAASATDDDGPAPITWSLGAGHTCGGSIGTGGGVNFTISGPVPPATCLLVIRACDSAATPACRNQAASITITRVNDAPVITSMPNAVLNRNVEYTYDPVRVDPDGPGQTWSLTTGNSCGGTINSATGRWIVTPTVASCNMSIQLCDGGTPNLCTVQTQSIRAI